MLIDNQKQFPSSITITYNQNAAIITVAMCYQNYSNYDTNYYAVAF